MSQRSTIPPKVLARGSADERREAHTCHWPGCTRRVPPRMWGCRGHWYALPKVLRDRIWSTYVPGQEITKTPSRAYVAAARAVQEWIAEHVKSKGGAQ